MAKRQRERAELNKQTRDRRPTAIAKYIRISSSKMEIVLDLIRGKGYDEAVAILKNTNKSACPVILKVLNSAAANAENNLNLLKDSLYVAECYAVAGPTLKRMMPRARGRADRIEKRTCHIRVTLDQKEDAVGNAPKKVTKAVKKSEGESMKTSTNLAKDSAKQKSTTKPKEVPNTQSERPLTEKPNTKKPLGTKSETVTKSKAESAVKKTTEKSAKATPKK